MSMLFSLEVLKFWIPLLFEYLRFWPLPVLIQKLPTRTKMLWVKVTLPGWMRSNADTWCRANRTMWKWRRMVVEITRRCRRLLTMHPIIATSGMWSTSLLAPTWSRWTFRRVAGTWCWWVIAPPAPSSPIPRASASPKTWPPSAPELWVSSKWQDTFVSMVDSGCKMSCLHVHEFV